MAALSSRKIVDFVERFLTGVPARASRRRDNPNCSVRALGSAHVMSGDEIDSIWLQRVELRSRKQAADTLDGMGFRSRPGCLCALFVDEACGLICAENLELAQPLDHSAMTRRVLRLASGYHAHGVILATNDPTGELQRSKYFNDFTMDLYHKGDAINVPVLDHLVLFAGTWKSMFLPNWPNRAN